jgi:3',5'-cyclic AMP phosphodiesterase CpdA
MAMTGFAGCHVDFFLSGHLHTTYVGHSATRYKVAGYSALIIQAGTATSTRRRGEANAYNIIRNARPRVSVECVAWNPDLGEFAISTISVTDRTAGQPSREPARSRTNFRKVQRIRSPRPSGAAW